MAKYRYQALPIHLQWFAEDTPEPKQEPQAKPADALPGQGDSDDLPDWMKDLPDPLKASKTLRRYADKATFADSYIELERKLSKSTVIPDKDSKPEDWEKFFSRTGRPKTADEYPLTPFHGYKPDPVFDAAFKAKAFARGLSKEAAADLYLTVTQQRVQEDAARQAEVIRGRAAALDELRTAWGPNFDAQQALAQKTYGAIFSPKAQAILKAAGLEDDPVIIADLAKHGALFKGDKIVDGAPPKGPTNGKAGTADPAHPYAYMKE